MKRLYSNLFGIILILVIILLGLQFLSTRGYTREFLAQLTDSEEYGVGGPEDVVPLINRGHKDEGTTKLILGDSFAHQTLNGLQEFNPEYAIMTSNAAVTMAGQYVIAKEYLDNHPGTTDVYLFVLPESIGRTYDTKWGYQYAVLPFVTSGTLTDLEDETIGIITDTYGKLFVNRTFASMVEDSLVDRKLALNYLKKKTEGYVLKDFYELSDIYLVKLAEMCKEKGANFHFYPCPVSEAKKEKVEEREKTFQDSATFRVNPDYFKEIYYYPEDWSADGDHLMFEYRDKQYIYPMYQEITGDYGFMESFNFGLTGNED